MTRLGAALLIAGLASNVVAQGSASGSAEVQRAYQKQEVRIKMRDGVELFTSIYTPRDTTKRYPVLLMRTPYSVAPYGPDAYAASLGPWKAFQEDGFIFVNQDVRGRYMADGYYPFMTPHIEHKTSNKDVDETSDTYDTIDWLIKNVPHNNGRVGTWGNSRQASSSRPGMSTRTGAQGGVSVRRR